MSIRSVLKQKRAKEVFSTSKDRNDLVTTSAAAKLEGGVVDVKSENLHEDEPKHSRSKDQLLFVFVSNEPTKCDHQKNPAGPDRKKRKSTVVPLYYHCENLNPLECQCRLLNLKKRLKCGLCSYEAIQRDHLLDHMRKHTGELPFACQECGLNFRTKAMVYRHVRNIHEYSGKKPLACSHRGCNYRTTQKDYLAAHMKRHGSDHVRKVPCPLCPRKFHTKAVMDVHLRIHLDEKPYKCQNCDYRARQPANVTAHLGVCRAVNWIKE